MEGTSGYGFREMSRPSAPIVPVEHQGDDFEVVPAATSTNLETHPQPYSESSAPPSYEAALNAAKNPPYPTSDPMGMPCPTDAVRAKDILPYPLADEERIRPLLPSHEIVPPPPNRIERVTPPPSRIGIRSPSPIIPPPARDAPVPLNIDGQAIRSEDSNDMQLCCTIVVYGIIGLIVFIVLISKASKY